MAAAYLPYPIHICVIWEQGCGFKYNRMQGRLWIIQQKAAYEDQIRIHLEVRT